jgi:hypothetical protein
MGRTERAVVAAALWAAVALSSAVASDKAAPDFGAHRASDDARYVASWVLDTADNQGRPFAIVDKRDARLYVFDAQGRLAGTSAALLGQARGDHSAPGVGERTQVGDVPFAERTTPSGRFVSEPGRNLEGEHVVWVEYATAFAIHRVRPGASRLAREARLATETPRDNRASMGCVVVMPDFYTDVVQPLLGRTRAVVYVLPEESSVRDMFSPL